jgi:transcriptional regulator with XRE-family HTH domain
LSEFESCPVKWRARNSRNLTQEELAERSGLSARYIGGIERADVSASVTVLGRIADALGIEPEALIRWSNKRH